jgi:voltage-gated potassium channel
MSRRLSELERRERWLAVTFLVLRVTAITALLLVVYYALPAGELSGSAALARLAIGCLVFVAITVWLIHRIVRADLPGLKAIEGLAVAVPLFLYLFASIYLSLSHASAQAFTESLSHTGALYLTITVFATVGFGDITPKTDVARMIVSLQMLLDLVLIGALVRIVVGAAKVSLSRTKQPPSGDA